MGVINRALLFLYTLLMACLALGAIAVALQFIPEPVLLNEYHYTLHQGWQAAAVCAVFFLISVHLLGCSFASQRPTGEWGGELLVRRGETGTVGISLLALRDLVSRVVLRIAGVRDVKTDVRLLREKKSKDLRLQIRLTLALAQEVNAPAVADKTRTAVLHQLSLTAGIEEADVQIRVDSISNAPTGKGRRVV